MVGDFATSCWPGYNGFMQIDLSSLLVLIKGAGDLATGTALRLHRAGLPVVMTEIARPTVVRRTVAFAQAVFDGACQVEGIVARRCHAGAVAACLAQGEIPVLVDPEAQCIAPLRPVVVVDAILAKRNLGTRLGDAPLVVALGPGFVAGVDCHAVVETNRGHHLSRVIWQGSAEPDTGLPGEVTGVGKLHSRVLRAPADGHVVGMCAIGDRVVAGDRIAVVQTEGVAAGEIVAPFEGILRGLIHPDVEVTFGMKVGDLDPRAERAYCFTTSDKSLAIGGGVLEAILSHLARNSPCS
jgi:xanthine dehydrogenase accessory factor